MPDARSSAAAHQQDFLPLSAEGAGREASRRREKERGRRGGGAAKARGRRSQGEGAGLYVRAGRGGEAWVGRCPPQPRPLPGFACTRAGRNCRATSRRPPTALVSLPFSPLVPPPTERARSRGACAEPPTPSGQWRRSGVGRRGRRC